jgi:CubicO group peptidase (beta-lactamase class C family)
MMGYKREQTMDHAAQHNNIADPKFRDLSAEVEKEMERLHVPGVALGTMYEGQEYIAGFGVTNIDHPLAVDADTLFQIGSITKTFVGTLAMRLVEAGKLELDAPLRRVLPDLRMADESVAVNVTMRHLLTHTGGWVGDYFDDMGYGDDALANIVTKVAGLPQLTPLGEVWSYNNSGFYLVGRAIEVLTGKTFEAAMQEWILDPLGMKMSFFYAHDVMTHRFAVGHRIENDQANVATPWPIGRAAHPAGGLVCTVGDLFRYARFHMGDGTTAEGERLLTQESLALMRTPQVAAGGTSQVGLTWFITDINGVRTIGHGGGTNGQITQLSIVPEHGFALVVLTNAGKGGEICGAAVKSGLKNYLGLVQPEATPIEVPTDQLEPYVGQYDSRMMTVDLMLTEGSLVLQATPKGGFPRPDTPPPPAPPPVKIALYAEDRAVALEPPYKDARIEFLRDPEGEVAWLRVGGRVHRRLG